MNKENIEKKRDSSFELLRIIAIMMVLTMHYLNAKMGGALSSQNIPSTHMNFYITRLMVSFSIVAVNCFILITGFFMYKKDRIKIGKVINLVLIFVFYNILAYGLAIGFNLTNVNKASLIKFGNTFITEGGWFIIIYAILYMLIPYINIVIKSTNQKQHRTLLIILLISFSIWPTFLSDITIKDFGYGIVQFIMMYLIGAYIHKYNKNNTNIWVYIGIYLITVAISTVNAIKPIYKGTFAYNTIFNVIGSVSLFLAFSKLKLNSRLINNIAKHLLGIYIFHVNVFLNTYIWRSICHSAKYYTSKSFVLHMAISVLGVFLVCLIVDILREKLFKYTVDKFTSKIKICDKEIAIDMEENNRINRKKTCIKIDKKLAT